MSVKKKKKTYLVTLTFKEDQHEKLKKEAQAAGFPLATYLKFKVLRLIKEEP